jgi:hypothetical protein
VKSATAGLLAAALTLAAGCHKADGLVVVSVSTPLTLSAPIDHLGVQLTSPYGATNLSVGKSPVTLPTSFGMLVSKRFDAELTVIVTAFDADYRVLALGTGMGVADKGERTNVKVILDQYDTPIDMASTTDLGADDLLPPDDSGGPDQ